MKTLLLRAAPLVLCLGLAGPVPAQPAAPPAAAAAPLPALTAEQWREDLRFMAAEMERRHANLFHKVSRERFAAAVADLDRRIPALERNEIIVGMMRIAAMVGDGHTRVDPRKDAKFGFPSLPLKLYLFEDGVYVRAAAPEHKALVGARIEAIGGVPIDEAIRRVSELASSDNEVGVKLFVPLYLNMPDILHALKLSPSRGVAPLTLSRNGRRWTAQVPAGEVEPLWPPDTDVSLVTPEGWADARSGPQPLWLQAPLDYHRLVDLPEEKALYAQLNMVTGVAGQTLGEFGERIRERAEAANPRAVILDLRLNHGGNHDLRFPFIRALVKAEDADTRLFVLTWRGAFSATEAILVDLDRYTDAVFVGEPAGSKPNSYGDAYRMPLPNSGISVRSSIDWNQLAGQSKDPWTAIDVATPYRFADYAAGRDPALAAALAYAPQPSLSERLLQAAAGGGVEAVRKAVADYRADPAKRYADQEQALLAGAQALSAAKRDDEALLVADLASRQFPASADAFTVLGLLAERAGKVDLARQAGTRTLELDPNNRVVRSLMERLQPPR